LIEEEQLVAGDFPDIRLHRGGDRRNRVCGHAWRRGAGEGQGVGGDQVIGVGPEQEVIDRHDRKCESLADGVMVGELYFPELPPREVVIASGEAGGKFRAFVGDHADLRKRHAGGWKDGHDFRLLLRPKGQMLYLDGFPTRALAAFHNQLRGVAWHLDSGLGFLTDLKSRDSLNDRGADAQHLRSGRNRPQ
jgi:hypothetical protein